MESQREMQSAENKWDISPEAIAPEKDAPEISIPELFAVLSRRKWIVGRSVLISAAVATLIAFLLPHKYRAEAVILTPQQTQPSLSTMAQLAGLGPAAGLSSLGLLSGLGLRNPADLYIGILESRTIADGLIKSFNLKQVYSDDDFYTARKHLARNTTVKTGKDTLIHIGVEDRDPNRAAQLANAYVDALASRNSQVAFTEASQRRVFYENQIAKEKDALADAEVALRDTQKSTGLVAPTGQAEGLIRAVSQLHAEILTREAQIEAMKAYATEDNPRFQTAQRGVSALKSELTKLERGNHVPGTPEVPAGDLPQAGLEYLRKYRNVKYHEALFEILAKGYEAARLDEAKSAPQIQLVDRAVTPERKSWPPRALFILMGITLAAVLSSLWILLTELRGPGIV